MYSRGMRSRNTIDYLTAWENLYNPDFKPTEIGRFRDEKGSREELRKFYHEPHEQTQTFSSIT